MIESRSQAAKYLDVQYHTVRWVEKQHGLTYPITEEALTAIRANMRPKKRGDMRRFKYRYSRRKNAGAKARRFGRFVADELKRLGWSRKWLALKCEVTEETVGHWIRGESYPIDPDKVRRVLGG